MGLPQLNTCCFLFDLKTGNIIMGCINAFLSFVLTVVLIVTAVTLGQLKTDILEVTTDPDERAAVTGAYALSIILVLMYLAKFLFDLLFIYGVVAERAGIIKAYMIMLIVFILLSMFLFYINFNHYNAWHIAGEVSYKAINCYAVMLNVSFYRTLNSREVV